MKTKIYFIIDDSLSNLADKINALNPKLHRLLSNNVAVTPATATKPANYSVMVSEVTPAPAEPAK